MPTEPTPSWESGQTEDALGGGTETDETQATADGETPPAVKFDQVVKQFGKNVVLDHLDFVVDPGERVTLIGPSGSGKTTILRLVMTLERVTNGFIFVNGQPLSHMPRPGGGLARASEKYLRQARRPIGMVFQQFNLFPNMTVLENVIEAPVHVLGTPKAQAVDRARELLEMVGLGDRTQQHPTSLSGGQQQRVAIARALAMEPDIL